MPRRGWEDKNLADSWNTDLYKLSCTVLDLLHSADNLVTSKGGAFKKVRKGIQKKTFLEPDWSDVWVFDTSVEEDVCTLAVDYSFMWVGRRGVDPV